MKKVLQILVFFNVFLCFSQNPSDRDPTYNPFNAPLNQYFFENNVRKIKSQTDNRLIVQDGESNKLKRLRNNILDTSFNVVFNNNISDFCILPNDKIIVVGTFTTCNGISKNKIVRLNSDGSIDDTFNVGTGYSGNLFAVEPTLNNAVIVKGNGSAVYNGTSVKNFFRINANGSLDASFNVDNIDFIQRYVNLYKIQPDGKIIVQFSNYNIWRLNADGSVDTSFYVPGLNSGDEIRQILLEPNGKIVIAGKFSTFDFLSYKGIVRLNADGTVDQTFQGVAINNDEINDLVRQADGKYVITGGFSQVGSVVSRQIARINSNGTLDATAFKGFQNVSNAATSVLYQQQDGKIIVYKFFDSMCYYQNELVINVIRTNVDGTIDNSFKNYAKGFYPRPDGIELQQNGKYLVFFPGSYIQAQKSFFNGQVIESVVQFNSDWTIDETFRQSISSNFITGGVKKARILEDGKMILLGSFNYKYQNINYYNFIILNPNGSVYYGVTSPTTSATDFDTAEDGKILITGNFTSFNGNGVNGIIRLLPSGQRDATFNYTGSVSSKNMVRQMPSGKIVFTSSSDLKLYQLNNNGSIDTGFSNNLSSCTIIESNPDGKLLVYEEGRSVLYKINEDGSIDANFVNNFPSTQITCLNVQPDGKILICSMRDIFTDVFRILPNGQRDTSFRASLLSTIDPSMTAYAGYITTLKNGKIFIGGYFSKYNNVEDRNTVLLQGKTYYFISGNNKYDNNSNGCDANDLNFQYLKYQISSGNQTNYHIANASGNYSIGMNEGSYTVTPQIENPSYFSIQPANITVNFPAQTSPQNQNFCIVPNGNHQDLEVVLIPVVVARPGFDSTYKIIYKNKGNIIVSGQLALSFPQNVMNLVTAIPSANSTSANQLIWNYTNLKPFENGVIEVKFNLNSPTETPPLNGGDLLTFTATVTPMNGDEYTSDNTSILNQTVINSYDPNDKTCLEGDIVSPVLVGKYVHYIIRFENTGNGQAVNVIVKDAIDISKFDLSSLIPLTSSHSFHAKIDNGIVNFIFENINLPFQDNLNNGYVVFKIKLKDNLIVGDTFSNKAEIYFDYNYPISTNNAMTSIQQLSIDDILDDKLFFAYPNPTKDFFVINSNQIINKIEIFSNDGKLVKSIVNLSAGNKVDISNLNNGLYFIKIIGSDVVQTLKILKE